MAAPSTAGTGAAVVLATAFFRVRLAGAGATSWTGAAAFLRVRLAGAGAGSAVGSAATTGLAAFFALVARVAFLAGASASGNSGAGAASTAGALAALRVRLAAFFTGSTTMSAGWNPGMARSMPRRGALKLTTTNGAVEARARTSRALRGGGSPRKRNGT